MKETALYTVVMGAYESLNELEIVEDQDVDRFCFTDNKQMKSKSWNVIYTKPAFFSDQVRSARMVKIKRPEIIRTYSRSLYVDNTVTLKASVVDILDSWLLEHDLAIPLHSFRSTVEDEFSAVSSARLDSLERIEEQLLHYSSWNSSVLAQRPLWSGMIARSDSWKVDEFENKWINHVLRYSRRDQLSVNIAIDESKVTHNLVEIDNQISEYHVWPILNNRNENVRIYHGPDARSDANLLAESLDLKIVELEEAHVKLEEAHVKLEEAHHQRMRLMNSKSFRITRPLRDLDLFIRKVKRIILHG